MRILHTSDWHLGKALYAFSLLEDQRNFLEQLIGVIRTQAVDAVVVAGDIYDRPVPPVGAVALYDYFLSQVVMELGVPVLAVAGNHDSAGRLEFGSRLYRDSGYYIAGRVQPQVERVTLEDAHGPVHFHLLPYLHPADVRAALPGVQARTYHDAWRELLDRGVELDPAARNVAVAHGFFASLGAGTEPLTSDSEVTVGGMDVADAALFGGFDYAALGHLHAPQRAGGEYLRYSGTPLKYSLSEEGQEKSLTMVELGAKGHCAVKLLPVRALRDVRVVAGGLDELLEPGNHVNKAFGDYVFARLSDTEALYPMEKLRTLFPRLLGLTLSGREEEARPRAVAQGRERLSTPELFFRFFKEMEGEEPNGELRGLVEEGLAALEQEEVTL